MANVWNHALRITISAIGQRVEMQAQLKTVLSLCTAFVLSLAMPSYGAVPEPAASLTALDGSAHTLRELRGHPAVVNFWATWCGPCREEMPLLQKMADAYAAKGVTFIAISIDQPAARAKIPAMVAKRGLHIPIWTGASLDTLKQLQLGEIVPATLVLDEIGYVIGRIEGEARERDIRSRLDWILGGKPGKPPKPVQKNDW
jgi:thiol-disulfide isomerase/thioredoxin